MKIMILGADGYMGWPTSIDFASKGHTICMVDNYIKRKLMTQYKRKALVNSPKLEKKIKFIKNLNKKSQFHNIDCSDSITFKKLFKKFSPDAVIHYAELPSAPYSMAGPKEGWNTLNNNLQTTFNLIDCVKSINPDCHIVKLGTMGEYGTPNIDIEEGWLNVNHNKRKQKFLYPRQGSSIYHTSKIMDTDLLWFYVRNYNLRVTDLMQGPVYGIYVNDYATENNLETAFAYDDMFGTIINRFIVQAVAGVPLTIYGLGSQIRGYINLKDSLKCMNIALENPSDKGKLSIFNQFTEQYSVIDIAKKIIKAFKTLQIDVQMKKIPNPRIEKEKHYYNAKNTGLKKLGLEAELLDENVIIEIAKYVMKNKNKINKKIITPRVNWK